MERVDTYLFYLLGSVLRALARFSMEPLQNKWNHIDSSQAWLADFIATYGKIQGSQALSSVPRAQEVLRIVNELDKIPGDKRREEPMPNDIRFELEHAINSFEISLNNDCNRLPIFLITATGNYDMLQLLQGASNQYAPETTTHLSAECKREIDESGRCLITGRATASGFHMLRAVELVIIQYLEAKSVMPDNNRNWGNYIRVLKENGASDQVVGVLTTIKNNYRNPVMHVEDILTPTEAVSLFGICESAINTLVKDMRLNGLLR